MKYAILADIHSNLEALQVVLEDAKVQKCTHYTCLGDVVGYNANPKECLDIIRDMGMPCVKGNHDEYCSIESNLEGFNPHAAEAIQWTRNQLTEEDRDWLRSLKYIRLVASFSIVHATLDGPQRWGYVFDRLAAAASFTYQNTRSAFSATRTCRWRSSGTAWCAAAPTRNSRLSPAGSTSSTSAAWDSRATACPRRRT